MSTPLPRVLIGLLAAVLTAGAAGAQQRLPSLEDACSYYGERIEGEIYGFPPDNAAEDAVQRVVEQTGLPQNFELWAANVPNAAAKVHEGKRMILYSQTFMDRITKSAQSDWAAISILAHEIGHHLSGHTLQTGGSRPELELQADAFSGFVLFKMGAALEEAQAATRAAGEDRPSLTHPPRAARLEAIANGWKRAQDQAGGGATREEVDTTPSDPSRDIRHADADPPSEEDEAAAFLECLRAIAAGETADCGDVEDDLANDFSTAQPIPTDYVTQCSFYDGSAVSVGADDRLRTFFNGVTLDVGFRRASTLPQVQYELHITSNDVYVTTLLTTLGVYGAVYYVDGAGGIWRDNGFGGYIQIGTCY